MTTINRRVRRIGLLPTTFKESVRGERKVKNSAGETVTEKIIERIPIRHSNALTVEERQSAATVLIAADRERHKAFRAARKAAKTAVPKKAA